jgi:hypothetical protein
MIDQEHASPEANAKGVCHTDEECVQMYSDLSPELKAPALAMLVTELAPVREEIASAYRDDPDGWHVPFHFSWGMAVRNLLRSKEFGEKYFGVHNLDDIYVPLVEEALQLAVADDTLERETFTIWNGHIVGNSEWDDLDEGDQARWKKMLVRARKK